MGNKYVVNEASAGKILHKFVVNEASAGKILQALLGIIHVTLLKTLQYLSSQILQKSSAVILDVVSCSHAIYHIKL